MKLIYLFLSFLAFNVYADMNMPVKGVYDGDTINTFIPSLADPLNKVSIRILGIDTAELHNYKCPEEKALAQKARARVLELMPVGSTITVSKFKWDKYGGRIDGIVTNKDGINVGQTLINENLAKAYDGGAKSSWCK